MHSAIESRYVLDKTEEDHTMDHAVSVIPENKTVTTYYQLCDCIIDAYPIKQILIILETQIQEAHIIFLENLGFFPQKICKAI